jgi:hypothetical protein
MVTQDRDELLAERPRSVNPFHAALDTRNAALRDVPCGDFIHDVPLSLQTVDEVVGQVTASRVSGLGRVPLLGDPVGRRTWFQINHRLDLRQRDLQLPRCGYQPSAVKLRQAVVAIPGAIIDPCRHQQTELVIEPERLGRQPRTSGELPNAHQIHLHTASLTGLPHQCAASPRVKVKRHQAVHAFGLPCSSSLMRP